MLQGLDRAGSLGYRAAWAARCFREAAKITGGTARFTTSRIAKLDWIRDTRGNRDSSVR